MIVVIVGLGSISKKHIEALKKYDDKVKVYALRSKPNAEVVSDVFNIYNLDEIQTLKPDFIIVSNPTGMHFDVLNRLKDLRIPLFIEKPLFETTNKEKDELVSQILRNNTPTYVACNLRFLDSIIKLKEIVRAERINEVNVYCGSYLPNWRPDVDYKTTYSSNVDMGGGVHLDLIHELDYVYWLFGMPEYSKSFFQNRSSLKISSNDYANYIWVYEMFTVSIVLNYYRKDAKRIIELVCESGTYFVDLLQNKITFDNKAIFESSQQIVDTYNDQMFFFIDHILNRKTQFNTIDQANKILKLCLAD